MVSRRSRNRAAWGLVATLAMILLASPAKAADGINGGFTADSSVHVWYGTGNGAAADIPGNPPSSADKTQWDYAYQCVDSPITLQPDTGWMFANVPTIAMVDREPRQLPTTILGRAVLIRANPGAMTWTWGDGTTTITYDRGNPYPNQTLTHTYAYFEGDVVITLTSTWSGEYSLDGGTTWRPAPGTARTDSTPIPLTVYNPHTHIVACDTNGNCRS